MLSILFIYFNHDSKTLDTGSHWYMRPNVKFRVDLPKTNPDLAKPHLQRHVATRKKKMPSTKNKREKVVIKQYV